MVAFLGNCMVNKISWFKFYLLGLIPLKVHFMNKMYVRAVFTFWLHAFRRSLVTVTENLYKYMTTWAWVGFGELVEVTYVHRYQLLATLCQEAVIYHNEYRHNLICNYNQTANNHFTKKYSLITAKYEHLNFSCI